MRENNFNVSKSKGELNMKRTIVILALVTAFVLAFTAVAQATWRGFTPTRTTTELAPLDTFVPNPAAGQPGHVTGVPVGDPIAGGGLVNGFLSFPEARVEMARNFGADGIFGPDDPGAGLQGTAHGGYVTTTTKCVVCHSAHRAPGLEDPLAIGSFANPGTATDRNRNQAFLTAGASSCEACHVASGSQASRLLVEWGPNGGGPHAAPRRGCMLCHNAGIHGLTNSSFNVMNVFMLGNQRRAGEGWCPTHVNTPGVPCPTCGVTGGNPGAAPPGAGAVTRDQQIWAEMARWTQADSRGNVTLAPLPATVPGGAFTTLANVDLLPRQNGNLWWAIGDRSLGPVGGIPPALNPGAVDSASWRTAAQIYGAARSMATAYTCGEAGCHTRGTFFTQNWGVGFTRNASIGINNNQSAGQTVEITGHVTPSVRGRANGANGACGPCHGGNVAGFPTASIAPGVADNSRRAYGCDQCHDMVGVATNSTAWPHGNRNIVVYEWMADGTQLDRTRTIDANGDVVVGEPNMAAAGNLWMYAGNIARARNAAGTGSMAAVTAPQGPTSNNTAFADQSWFVMTGVTSGRYGVEALNLTPAAYADFRDGRFGTPASATGLVDGSCLKCHVAIDSASMNAMGSTAADALRHSWGEGSVVAPTWDGNPVSGSQRLFLYR